jgi:hypothetical protein
MREVLKNTLENDPDYKYLAGKNEKFLEYLVETSLAAEMEAMGETDRNSPYMKHYLSRKMADGREQMLNIMLSYNGKMTPAELEQQMKDWEAGYVCEDAVKRDKERRRIKGLGGEEGRTIQEKDYAENFKTMRDNTVGSVNSAGTPYVGPLDSEWYTQFKQDTMDIVAEATKSPKAYMRVDTPVDRNGNVRLGADDGMIVRYDNLAAWRDAHRGSLNEKDYSAGAPKNREEAYRVSLDAKGKIKIAKVNIDKDGKVNVIKEWPYERPKTESELEAERMRAARVRIYKEAGMSDAEIEKQLAEREKLEAARKKAPAGRR